MIGKYKVKKVFEVHVVRELKACSLEDAVGQIEALKITDFIEICPINDDAGLASVHQLPGTMVSELT